jgi:hypothetical protein
VDLFHVLYFSGQAREREAGKKIEQYEERDPWAQVAYIKCYFGQTSLS